jgi:hypothetical protein
MYKFCKYYDPETGVLIDYLFVKVIELTHEKSAVKRALVEHKPQVKSISFYETRERLVEPLMYNSDSKFVLFYKNKEFIIEVKAIFYKHPDKKFIDKSTPYIINDLKCNGIEKSMEELQKIIGAPQHIIDSELHEKLLYYVDDLYF